MHQIGIVGLSYRHASTDEVARFSIPKADVPARLPELREALGVSELIYLGTCNRVEVIFATRDDVPAGDCRAQVFRLLRGREPAPGEAVATLRAWTGEAAVEHLLLVTCGLDSAQAGEREILAQVRGAWDDARAAGVSGPVLDRIVADALSTARHVQRLGDAEPAPSLADLGVERVLERLRASPGTVALVGVSPMTRRCGERLRAQDVPLLVVNRSRETGEELAATLGAQAMPLDEFRANPPPLAALIAAAGGSEPLLAEDVLRRLVSGGARPFIVDFGLPPNIDPDAARHVGLDRIGMEELVRIAQEQRLRHLMRLAPVRAAIDDRLARLRSDLAARALGPRLHGLRSTFEQIAASELDRLLSGELQGLDERQREILKRWACTMARRLAHLPLSGIRAAAEYASPEALDAFFREARLGRGSHTAQTSEQNVRELRDVRR